MAQGTTMVNIQVDKHPSRQFYMQGYTSILITFSTFNEDSILDKALQEVIQKEFRIIRLDQ